MCTFMYTSANKERKVNHGEGYNKLSNQPLTLVVAEFRFAPLNLDCEELWSFREQLDARMNGRAMQNTVQNARFEAEGLRITASPLLRWHAEAAGESVQLEADRLIFSTTQYPRFPDFSNKVKKLLASLEETMPLHGLRRIGLRYNDAIVPEAEEDLADYLQAAFLPWPSFGEKPLPVARHTTETIFSTPSGTLAIRALLGCHGQSFMPDVRDRFGLQSPIEVPDDSATAVLDFDHYWQDTTQENTEFSVDKAIKRLGMLHEPAREAFWNVTTDFARNEKWR